MHSNHKKAQKIVTYSSHKNDQLLYQNHPDSITGDRCNNIFQM